MTDLPTSMRAVRPQTPGKDGKPDLVIAPVPQPAAGEVLIKVKATALNRADLIQVQGFYPPPPGASDILGLECAGTIAALGEGVTKWRIGDEVVALIAGGGYAEYCAAPEGSCLAKPAALSWEEAGATAEAFFTVWTNVSDRCRLAPGETLLVHGGASGIGTTAIQLYAAQGHTVFATAGGPEKVALCEKLGAKRGIDYKSEDFVEVIKTQTSGKGVDVILDMVGGDYIPRNIQSLALEGRLVNIAYQQGSKVEVNFGSVLMKRLTVTGSTLRARTAAQKAQVAAGVLRDAWPLLESGRIKPVVDSVFPLEKVAEAHARMAAGTHAGKIVLTVG
ncbi:Phthiocerol synthesis polyketide synthase type I PpsC [Alphaproteobacteria bacterium SO-S41]|nr:Phthiocerol synthesis polyketide synthase type I PpsC [Alphaproteobacteria bacterium SO-S41]